MNTDVEFHIRHNYPWAKLPANVKQSLGNSHREYEKAVFNFSVKNQLRYKGNLVRYVKKDEKRYYEELLRYSREHLMLYPYHLSDVMVKGLRITPFGYYLSIMSDIMAQEKSYDSLPNFTAADCLRLLGIGRNQYIDLMNQCRSSKKFFRKKSFKELLPPIPVESVIVEAWWVVQAGYITEEDVKMCSVAEKGVIDKVIDNGPQSAGDLDYKTVHGLYRKGLIYMDVPIADDDCIIVPPLEGFVMNRVLGDYFETLLYKIFVSIDEHTSVAELANVLQIDPQLVKNAVSMYCRLAFAKKKSMDVNPDDLHPSWKNIHNQQKKPSPGPMLIDWDTPINDSPTEEIVTQEDAVSVESSTDMSSLVSNSGHSKRIAFLFDSTLTAFLMMGNLSPGLKSHAVTMFEVGKLSDESLDSFLNELEKVDSVAEGEAQRYFDHALTLRDTIRFLRYNKELVNEADGGMGYGIDLLRCESLLGLDPATCARVLNKNYRLLVSMAPLSNEIRPVSSCAPQHLGPAIPEVNSVWFKLFIYSITGCGPDSLLLVKGTKLLRLPKVFQGCEKLLITTWGHDPGVIPASNILLMVNDALQHSAVLMQVYGCSHEDGHTEHIPFPFEKDKTDTEAHPLGEHSAIQKLSEFLDLERTCGYVTLLHNGGYYHSPSTQKNSPDKLSPTGSQHSSPGSGSKSPQNGIKDSASAEMLASELDSLDIEEKIGENDQEKMSLCKDKLTLDVVSSDASMSRNIDSEWVLLECCYGIPLFASELNRSVYERIASHGLVNNDSLHELLHSSRKLSLKLLNFIAENQDLPVFQETNYETSPITSSFQGDQSIPLPTRNLIFTNGVLQTWDGQ